ncbi:MAG: hypothetical protein A2X25_11810 [Chloroflexi bacterium GWB2_49_20]|nr:MAG: hypothetical protein A2X25_11810 [Chloroflexi bacterium GWB2_49_20]OGN77690.1 MAG: hypothetical protein A2X26_10080 [Chloroflexi bacterium GWC2_49_37]OGN86465.1 MAG: hypothetical protein A2X27_06235 [Chloroflexi bacterium GWD2_49_16]HBG74711.1 hypothetical protein [Anaerolineae bacterium]
MDIIGLMKRIIPFTLIGLGTLFVIAAIGWVYFDNTMRNPATLFLPEQLAGLPLSSQMNGPQAVEDFSNLHGKQFPLTSGALGIYGNQQATLWVAGAPINFMAANMVTDMHDKIAVGNSPFTPSGEYLDNKRTIYKLEGMGQKHFYFQSKNLVIWLTADAEIAEIALQQLKEFYP